MRELPTQPTCDLAGALQMSLYILFNDRYQRPIKSKDTYETTNDYCPTIIFNTEYLSNQKSRGFLTEVTNQRKLGFAICDAVQRYFRGF